MIISALIYITGAFLNLIYVLFSAISFTIPDEISDSLTYFLSYFVYANGIIPVATLMSALGTIVSFMMLMYTIRIVLFTYHLLPWIGKNVSLPHGTNHKNTK